MEYFVNKGAKLKCPWGSEQSELEVVHIGNPVILCGKLMANIADNKPVVNIKPFGKCSSMANPAVAAATAANYGRLQKMPCVPITPFPWVNGKMNLIINGSQALLSTSKCACSWSVGRLIEVSDPGQNSVYVGGPMNITINEPTLETLEALGRGLLPDQGGIVNQAMDSNAQTQISPNIVISQNTETNADAAVEAVTVTSTQQISVVSVKGVDKAFSKQELRYKVTSYKKGQSMVSADSIDEDIDKVRDKIKWAVKVGKETIQFKDDNNNEIKYGIKYENQREIIVFCEIPDDWADEDIFVSARIEESDKEASYKTNIGPRSQMLLIRMVEGKYYALYGRTEKYTITRFNKDESSMNEEDKKKISNIRWDIKVGIYKQETLKDANGIEIKGQSIDIEIKEKWAGEKITIMPYLSSPTDIVSVKTKVGWIFLDLHSDINNSRRAFLSEKERDLLIVEIIDAMGENNPSANWVKDTQSILKTEPHSKRFLKVKLVEKNGMPQGASEASAAFDKGYEESNSEYIVFFNVDVIGNERASVEKLQAYFIHELRHFWQAMVAADDMWKKKLEKRIIDVEVDAFDIQFKLEKHLDIFGKELDLERSPKPLIRHTYENKREYMKDHLYSIYRKIGYRKELEGNMP